MLPHTHILIQKDRQTYRETNRPTERGKGREEREREREREREYYSAFLGYPKAMRMREEQIERAGEMRPAKDTQKERESD